MWLYVCILLVVPQGFFMVDENHDSNGKTSDEEESEFGEVVKNISRVNDVLEKLITNYEHLKRLYKSNETDDSSSEDANDDVLKAQMEIENSNQTEVLEANTASTDRPTSANKENDHEGSFTNSEDKEYNENDEINFHVQTGHKEIRHIPKNDPPMPKSAQLQPNLDHTNKKEMQRSNLYLIDKKTPPKHHKETNAEDKYEVLKPNPKLKKSEIIFIDPHRTGQRIVLEPQSLIRPKLKTKSKRYSNSTNYDKTAIAINDGSVRLQDENEKKVAYFKYSSRNQRTEDTSNKPGALRQGNRPRIINSNQEVIVDLDDERSKNTSEVSYTHNVKTNEDKSETEPDLDELLITKDQFKTDVLRTAYDEACLKLVIRKCHKACKGAIKNVCRHFNCKSNFKNRFLLYEKRNCIKEFGGDEVNNTQKSLTTEDIKKKIRRSNDLLANDAYLSAACFNSEARREGQGSSRRSNLTQIQPKNHAVTDKKINILRDRLERACRTISATKCKTACNLANNQACEDFKCNKDMKSDFNKYCNRQCQSTFKVDDDSDTSSGSSGSDTGD